MGKYAKALVAVLGVVITALAPIYSHAAWFPVVVSVLTAFGVYVVPNKAGVDPPTKPSGVDPPPNPKAQVGLPVERR